MKIGQKPETITVHILRAGDAICGKMTFPPSSWPIGHKWVDYAERDKITDKLQRNGVTKQYRCSACFAAAEG